MLGIDVRTKEDNAFSLVFKDAIATVSASASRRAHTRPYRWPSPDQTWLAG